jgi:uncharacterized phage protein (TIGR01671 family)
MRQIKFRAWHKVRKEMYEVYGLTSEYVFKKTDDGVGNPGVPDKLEDVELMQYTGLKDKNGKEIYEGDILVFTTLSDSGITETKHDPVFIQWNNYKSTYDFNDNKNRVLGDYPFFKYWTLESMRQYEVEVIGNIYENPNLIN